MTTEAAAVLTQPQSRAGESLSERLAAALREGRADAFEAPSPYAACLLPLLKALGWHNYARDLIEALPHFAETLDLVDLRNILATLGYESTVRKTRVESIKDELFPCLFVSSRGAVQVLLKREGPNVRYFDAEHGETSSADISSARGTAYLFTDTHPTRGIGALETQPETWFAQLLRRFRRNVVHLLAMTLLINLIALAVPLFIMLVYDKVIGAESLETLPYMAVGLGCALVADVFLRSLRARLLGAVAGRLDYLIGVETFRQLLFLPPLLTERSTVAAQLSRLRQFDAVRDFFTGPSAAIVLELPFAVLFILVIYLLAGPIGLVPVSMILAFVVFGIVWLPGLTARVSRTGKARTDKQRMIMQTLAGRREIKSVGGEANWQARFRETSGEAAIQGYRTAMASAIMNIVAQSLMTVAGVAVLGFGAFAVMAGELSVGALIATMALVWRVLSPLQSAFLGLPKYQQTVNAIKQINQLMRLKPERQSGQSALMLAELKGRITVDRVSFRYGPDKDPALLGVSFAVEPGEFVAVVGQTGSGKSTILKLIAGMYRPQAGALAIDDLDIRQLNAMDLRRAIAFVPQKPKLFHGTVAQNLRLNNVLATDRDLEQAAKQAGALEDILAQPDGFDMRLGDNASDRLPPGFAHALSLTRAFVRPTQILLLDEPGASMDRESDTKFIEQIKKLRGKCTIIMVSHRPSHVRLADKAIVMHQGSVRLVGSADQAVALMMEGTS